MTVLPFPAAERRLFFACAVLLAVALLAGGSASSRSYLAVELASLPLLFVLVHGRRVAVPWLAWVAVGCLLLAMLQLVPLPPDWWTALPARALAVDVLKVARLPLGWRPLALDPAAAAAALAGLVPALLLLVGVGNLGDRARLLLVRAIVLFALGSAVLGLAQRFAGAPALYDTAHAGASLGLFINRNHQATLIVVAVMLVPLAVTGLAGRLRLSATAVIALLGLSVLATTSRMGLLLACVAVPWALTLLWRPAWRWVWAGLAAYGVGIAVLLGSGGLAPIRDRLLQAGSDDRLDIARNTLFAAREVWPAGSGYGSFVPVYAAFEDLDGLYQNRIIAAHNDYLQVVMEGGLAGLVTLAILLASLAVAAARGWRRRPVETAACGGALLLILLHSTVDYPLRMPALLLVFACMAACLSPSPRPVEVNRNYV